MPDDSKASLKKSAILQALGTPHMLAFIPLFTLGSYWAGGEIALIGAAISFPVFLAGIGRLAPSRAILRTEIDSLTGHMLRDGLITWIELAIPEAAKNDRQVAVITLTIDDLDAVEERFGRDMRDRVLSEASKRLKTFVRAEDAIARLGSGFAIGLRNVRAPETENLLQLSRRLQAVFDEPFSDGPTRTYCSVSIGIAAECHVKGGAVNVVAGAQRAGELAAIAGAGSVRVYSDGLSSDKAHDRDIARDLSNALETGEIFAWYQPQIDTATGDVAGFEALARWEHPERGLVSPNSFLPDIEKAGLSQRLAEVVLKQALTALSAWDSAGFGIPSISVNFSGEELRNPRLSDYVRWELDRHNLAPERLVIEVLESVVAESNEDVILRTLTSLSRFGCRIDLDDFGTGFTSLINIYRFNVSQIKIDRSLISQIDKDKKQLTMLSAILAFSEKLEIDVLAEGVETEEEVEVLKSLGCRRIQGYISARPMPLGETLLSLEDNAPLVAETAPIKEKRA